MDHQYQMLDQLGLNLYLDRYLADELVLELGAASNELELVEALNSY